MTPLSFQWSPHANFSVLDDSTLSVSGDNI
jgi:hypothetical protein